MSDLIVRIEGRAGCITLNKPETLNALDHDMARAIDEALSAWVHDDAISLVVIDAVPGKAFCAGGDIQAIYHQGKAGDFGPVRDFWRFEYLLNIKIAHYPKPYVALIDGIDMGGGVGISCHGSHRIVGDHALIAMPECSIGLIPDVGVSKILADAGALGRYLALTGTRIKAADAIEAGFADDYVPSDQFSSLRQALTASGSVDVISDFAQKPGLSGFAQVSQQIATFFADGDPPAIAASLAKDGSDWAQQALTALNRASPLSAFCTLAVIDAVAANPSLETAVRSEFRFTYRSVEDGELLEGIRAAVIDKDRSPRWRHATFADVRASEVAHMVGSLGDAELKT